MALGKAGWVAGGLIAGFILAGVTGVMVINVFIPWEDICDAIGPMQTVAQEGRTLISLLIDWLEKARGWLDTASNAPSSLGDSLGGLLGRVGEITGDAVASGVDFLTAPLSVLIDVAQSTLEATESVVRAVQSSLSAVDESRC